MRIAIAGAGIAGLTSAIALSTRGFEVEVFERTPRLEEIGAGIQLSPNATAVLQRLGVMEELGGKTSEPDSLAIRDARSGAVLKRLPLGPTARSRYGAPYCTLLRADLQAALLATARRQPSVSITLGAELRDVRNMPMGVTFMAGRTARRADVLVAADGVHSTIRSEVFGYPGPVQLERCAWRTVIPAREATDHVRIDEVGLWLGAGGHLVHYPVARGEAVNIVAIAGGNAAAPPVLPFGPIVRELMNCAKSWMQTPLSHIDPARKYVSGRVVLIGDAAHAMAPSAAQGGAQAIEDADSLGRFLAATGTEPESALTSHADSRTVRVARVARVALRNLNAYELAGVPAALRNLTLRISPATLLSARLDWLFSPKPK